MVTTTNKASNKGTPAKGKRVNYAGMLWRLIRILFSSVRRVLNLLFALLLLLSVSAQVISPESTTIPAFLGMAYPFLWVIICLFAVYSLIRRARGYFIANLILLAAVSPTTFTYLPVHESKPITPSRDEIKVLSLNTQAFGYEKHLPDKPNPVLSYIKESGADIVCLQEALLIDRQKGYVSEATLKSFLPQFPYIDRHTAQPSGGSSLILLSKYPIENARRIPLSSVFNGGMAYVLRIGSKKLTVVNLHLESFRLTNRDAERYLELVKDADTQALRDQMGQKLGTAFRKRAEQVDALRMDPAFTDSKYLLIAGDFNDTPISYTRYRLAEGRTDAFRHSGSGCGFSFTYHKMSFRLDHIIHSKNIRSRYCRVDNMARISDHQPISCYIMLE